MASDEKQALAKADFGSIEIEGTLETLQKFKKHNTPQAFMFVFTRLVPGLFKYTELAPTPSDTSISIACVSVALLG
jgi:hypothetical protein